MTGKEWKILVEDLAKATLPLWIGFYVLYKLPDVLYDDYKEYRESIRKRANSE